MSNQRFMPTRPYWADNATKDQKITELMTIEQRFADANAGKDLISPQERGKLETRRKQLKQEIHDMEKTEFHQPVNRASMVARRERNGCELRRLAVCDTPGHVMVTSYVDVPPNEQSAASRRLTNELKAANAAATGRRLYMAAVPYFDS